MRNYKITGMHSITFLRKFLVDVPLSNEKIVQSTNKGYENEDLYSVTYVITVG